MKKNLKTINIKGKEYVEVNERLKYFRENYKDYALTTEVLQCTEEHCVMKASIFNAEGVVIATGHAHETRGSSFINKTSHVEVCETSAWGRALGNFGIGIDSSVASADEVQNAIINDKGTRAKNKTTKKKLTTDQFDAMMMAISDKQGLLVKQRMDSYDIDKEQMDQLNEAIKQNM
mgnify:FL=1|tara:strand:- start:927 stop:1454 length:528 start_codon:yes stop_codon:yes gene_type:complete